MDSDLELPLSGNRSRSKKNPVPGWSWITTIPVISGFIGSLIVLYIAHAVVTPSERNKGFSTSTCQAPPSDCWDGWAKESFPPCIKAQKPTLVRGDLYDTGDIICYKAVYYNIEPQTFKIACWFIFWALLTSRIIERTINVLLFQRTPRWSIAFGMTVSFWSVWYSCSVIIHYLNDSNYEYFGSQMFFSLTELFVFIIAGYLVDARTTLPPTLLHIALGTSLYHIFQLLLDEKFLFFGNPSFKAILRNIGLFSGDAFFSYAFASVRLINRRQWMFVVGVMFGNFIMFQFIFADSASYSVMQTK